LERVAAERARVETACLGLLGERFVVFVRAVKDEV
jgi:hypothetical protein